MKQKYKKHTQLLLATTLLATLSACSLWDLSPDSGFPEMRNPNATTPDLAPAEAFDFHDSPRIA